MIEANEANFAEQVVGRSKDIPVLVDFWAPWCGPCRALGPVLEQLESKDEGRFVLAKVNTDESPKLAQFHQIRGIPAVKLYRQGRVVAEFTGALPVADVMAFLDWHIPDAAAVAAQRAAELIATGDFAGADAALAAAPLSGSPLAMVTRARVALLNGRLPEARAAAANVPATADEREIADAIIELVAFAEAGAAAEHPATAEAHYLAAGAALTKGSLTTALDHLLEVVRLDRKFREDGGRKRILELFQVAGVRSETSDDYRRRLAKLL